jgi:hypothetical protein
VCYVPPPARLPMRCPPGRALPGVAGSVRLRAKLAPPAPRPLCQAHRRRRRHDLRAVAAKAAALGIAGSGPRYPPYPNDLIGLETTFHTNRRTPTHGKGDLLRRLAQAVQAACCVWRSEPEGSGSLALLLAGEIRVGGEVDGPLARLATAASKPLLTRVHVAGPATDPANCRPACRLMCRRKTLVWLICAGVPARGGDMCRSAAAEASHNVRRLWVWKDCRYTYVCAVHRAIAKSVS